MISRKQRASIHNDWCHSALSREAFKNLIKQVRWTCYQIQGSKINEITVQMGFDIKFSGYLFFSPLKNVFV